MEGKEEKNRTKERLRTGKHYRRKPNRKQEISGKKKQIKSLDADLF